MAPRRRLWPYEYAVLPTDALFVDARYQRPLSHFANEITENWDPTLVGTLVVSRRAANRYAIVDGQHRFAAGQTLGVGALPCVVYDLSERDEAHLFARLQRLRRNVRPLDRYRAELFAGDERAVFINRQLKRFGITATNASGSTVGPDDLAAIVSLEWIYNRDPELIPRVLETLIAAWPQRSGRFAGEILKGLALFFTRRTDVDTGVLIYALGENIGTPTDLTTRSSSLRKGRGTGGASAEYTRQVIDIEYTKAWRVRRNIHTDA